MMKMVIYKIIKKILIFLPIIIFTSFLSIPNLFSDQLYDLCYHTKLLNNGKTIFLRYRNPLLDPVLKTYEIHVYNPGTAELSILQKYNEKIYIFPIVSRDKTTICYHSLIEGNDYLVTKNIEIWKSTRLRFDTGGYFVCMDIDYDNDTVASVIKRGENKQAIYVISNRNAFIKRILNGKEFSEIGFLNDGNIYYKDKKDGLDVLGKVYVKSKRNYIIAEGVKFTQKTPGGDAIIYSVEKDLYLYKVHKNESVKIINNFNLNKTIILFSDDGSTCTVIGERSIRILNIPSGDVMYLLSLNTDDTKFFLSNFNLYLVKANKVFELKHKRPGESLKELLCDEKPINIVGISPQERYIAYTRENKKEIFIFNKRDRKTFSKKFQFNIEKILFPKSINAFYIISVNRNPKDNIPVKELFYYNFDKDSLFAISTMSNTNIKLYLRNR